jgi:hypothetical protein
MHQDGGGGGRLVRLSAAFPACPARLPARCSSQKLRRLACFPPRRRRRRRLSQGCKLQIAVCSAVCLSRLLARLLASYSSLHSSYTPLQLLLLLPSVIYHFRAATAHL